MATPQLVSPEVSQTESEAQPIEPIEAIHFPDGSIEPAYPLALNGLVESLRAGAIGEQIVAQMYNGWDPEFSETSVYRHIHGH